MPVQTEASQAAALRALVRAHAPLMRWLRAARDHGPADGCIGADPAAYAQRLAAKRHSETWPRLTVVSSVFS
ncbi:hypothetical protein [Achromobacter agilis]|uniref:hypothetical protein n=1 Tax=Achromobacter agilis TaxID=1353888 RepID=UPI0010109581|nr:hypothetical protein [Achromobacter agilis]